MSTCTDITTRILICLAAVSVPMQGLPSWSCGCEQTLANRSVQPTGSNGCCQSVRNSCCHGTRHSCCGRDETCQCGASCRCGQPNRREPATPVPLEESQPVEKLLSARFCSQLAQVNTGQAANPRGALFALHGANLVAPCISCCRLEI